MKRLFVAIAALGLSAAVASAQDFNAAVDAFNAGAQALESNKTEALAKFKEALPLFEACEEEEAAEKVAECKRLIPNIILSLAKEQIKESNFDVALATLAEAREAAATYGQEEVAADAKELTPKVYTMKANGLMKAKDFAGAIPVLQEVIGLNPEDGKTYMLLGQAQLQTGAMDDAIASLTKAGELGENTSKLLSTTYLKKGQALMKAGKNAEAIEALETSNSYVESANAYKLIASIQTKSGKSAQAIEAYKKYLEVDPNAKDAADILFTIAATAQKAGDKATAKEYYGKLAGTKYAAQAEAQLKTL